MIPQTKIEQAEKEKNFFRKTSPAFNGHQSGFTHGVRFAESEMGHIAQEFAKEITNLKNTVFFWDEDYNEWRGFKDGKLIKYKDADLFAKFMEERNQITCPSCGSTRVLDWPDKYQCRRCEHTWER